MADFRKMFFVFAGARHDYWRSGTGKRAGPNCTAFVANQPTHAAGRSLRSRQATLFIQCTGTPVGSQTAAQTVSLYVSGTSITSRQLYSGTTVPSSIPTEAALLIDDCTSTTGSSPTYGVTCGSTFAPAQGFLQNGALVFTNFTLPTGQPNNNAFQLRITNVRLNANTVAAGTFISGTVLGTFPIQNQGSLVLGVAQSSLSVSLTSSTNQSVPYSFSQCTSTGTSWHDRQHSADQGTRSDCVQVACSRHRPDPSIWVDNGDSCE